MLNAREYAEARENLLNGRRPAFDGSIFGVYCAQRGATDADCTPECENDVDRTEVVEKISARDNCNESR